MVIYFSLIVEIIDTLLTSSENRSRFINFCLTVNQKNSIHSLVSAKFCPMPLAILWFLFSSAVSLCLLSFVSFPMLIEKLKFELSHILLVQCNTNIVKNKVLNIKHTTETNVWLR